jgi:hypothetical protein
MFSFLFFSFLSFSQDKLLVSSFSFSRSVLIMRRKRLVFLVFVIGAFLVNFHNIHFKFEIPDEVNAAEKLLVENFQPFFESMRIADEANAQKLGSQKPTTVTTMTTSVKITSVLKKTSTKTLQSNAPLKHILFYTNFWSNRNWQIGNETVGSEHPHFERCSRRNCVFTNNRYYLKNFTDYDALIFHTAQGWLIKGVYWRIPEFRKPNQLYIAAVQE